MEAAAPAGELPRLVFALPSVQELASLSISSFAYELPAHQLHLYHQYVCSSLLACDGFDITKLDDVDLGAENTNSLPKLTTASSPTLPENEQQQIDSSTAASAGSTSFIDKISTYPGVTYRALPACCEENPLGAWTLKCSINVAADDANIISRAGAHERPLYGKRVVVKDNIPIRGMPMYCGTSSSFTPLANSPLITRCLAAGATIVGKGQCEYMCFSGSSHTASAGVVRNPGSPDYHAGGSSSGCAVLVCNGEADLSIGCDQGGSCRIPGAICGVVGCKPTHGLVPYTFIDGMYGPIDHAGPITQSVEDNALMLGVLAGWDGVDERASSRARSMKKVDYCKELKEGVKGMKIGLVEEGLKVPFMEEDVRKATEDLAGRLREMGAKVETVSVPSHFTANGIWVLSVLPSLVIRLFYSTERDPLLGVDEHGKVYDRLTFMRQYLLAHVASWSFHFRIAVLVGEWLRLHFPESIKVAEVYKQRLIGSYASALSRYDVLLMPTTACRSKKLPAKHLSTAHDYEQASAELLAEHVNLGFGLTENTTSFNVTGHPALSVPINAAAAGHEYQAECGSDAAALISKNNDRVALPIGMMLVGDYFQEAVVYRVAYALEQAARFY